MYTAQELMTSFTISLSYNIDLIYVNRSMKENTQTHTNTCSLCYSLPFRKWAFYYCFFFFFKKSVSNIFINDNIKFLWNICYTSNFAEEKGRKNDALYVLLHQIRWNLGKAQYWISWICVIHIIAAFSAAVMFSFKSSHFFDTEKVLI